LEAARSRGAAPRVPPLHLYARAREPMAEHTSDARALDAARDRKHGLERRGEADGVYARTTPAARVDTRVADGAGIAVVAARGRRLVAAGAHRIAHVGRARVAVVARRPRSLAHALPARVVERAGIAVVARRRVVRAAESEG